MDDFNINFLFSLVQWIILIFLLAISGFPLIWVNKVVGLVHNILKKGLICNELFILHNILVPYNKVLNKLRNLLNIMNRTENKSGIRNILKGESDESNIIRPKLSGTLKALSIYQYFIAVIFNMILWMNITFGNIYVVQSLLKSTTGFVKNSGWGVNIDLRSGFYYHHKFQHFLKKRILKKCSSGTPLIMSGSGPLVYMPTNHDWGSWNRFSCNIE